MFNPAGYSCRVTDRINVECDICNKTFSILLIAAKRNAKRNNGKIECQSCSAKEHPKPQNSKSYWTQEKKEQHSKSIISSDLYYESLKTRKTDGVRNGMFGKKHSEEFRRLMALRLTGKKQSKETVEKRTETLRKLWAGREKKTALNCRVRGFLHKQLNWYYRVFKRDNFKCVICKSRGTGKLDAHHKEPLSKIIERNVGSKIFSNQDEKFNFLITCPEIIDENLDNGLTVCRSCHKKIHFKWGSHNAKT